MASLDALTLRTAMERARKRSPEALQRVREAVALMKQRASAADSLWAGGHAAEGLSMAREAYEAASVAAGAARDARTAPPEGEGDEVEAVTVDRAGLFESVGVGKTELAAAERGYAAERPLLDDDVSFSDAEHVKAMLRVVSRVERALRDDVRTPTDVKRSVMRRIVGLALVLLVATLAIVQWARAASVEANAAWIARYYPRTNFGGEVEREHEPEIDFDWGATSPMMSIPSDHFSARFDACLEAPTAQTLQIGLGSDDGSRVFVDGHAIVNNWRAQAYTWKNGEVELEAGMHHIRVEYFEGGGNAKLQLQLQSNDGEFDGTLSRPTAPDNGCGETSESTAVPATGTMRPTPMAPTPMLPTMAPTAMDDDADMSASAMSADMAASEMAASAMAASEMAASEMAASAMSDD